MKMMLNDLPDLFRNTSGKNKVIIVYTPAIPAENSILTYLQEQRIQTL